MGVEIASSAACLWQKLVAAEINSIMLCLLYLRIQIFNLRMFALLDIISSTLLKLNTTLLHILGFSPFELKYLHFQLYLLLC